MAYGMQIYNADNTLAYDSSSPGGVFVQFITLPTNIPTQSNIINLSSDYNGMTIELFILSSGDHNIYLQQGNVESGQNPTIIWSNSSSTTILRKPTIIMVLAK